MKTFEEIVAEVHKKVNNILSYKLTQDLCYCAIEQAFEATRVEQRPLDGAKDPYDWNDALDIVDANQKEFLNGKA